MRFYWCMVAILVSGCANSEVLSSYKPDPHGPPRELDKYERVVILDDISKELKDPNSAMFKYGPVFPPVTPDGVVVYCGLVNAKNSYGGYTGFTPYIASLIFRSGKVAHAALIDASVGGTHAEANLLMCEKNGYEPYSIQ